MYDVVVIGGGIAGMSAALILGRTRRKVLVLDGGAPRNLPAAHAHGLVTRDGAPPLELLAQARRDLEAYPNVEVIGVEAAGASGQVGEFEIELCDGGTVTARRIVLATGVRDSLAPVDGLQEFWGRGVYHCPFCHGWEVRDRTWAVLGDTPRAYERLALYRGWASELILLTNGPTSLDDEDRARIEAMDVTIDERVIDRVEAIGDEALTVLFDDGSVLTAGALFVAAVQEQRSHLPEELGCKIEATPPMGSSFVQVDAMSSETSVAGVYGVGDMAGQMQSLIMAAASGARAAYHTTHSLAMEDAAISKTAA